LTIIVTVDIAVWI